MTDIWNLLCYVCFRACGQLRTHASKLHGRYFSIGGWRLRASASASACGVMSSGIGTLFLQPRYLTLAVFFMYCTYQLEKAKRRQTITSPIESHLPLSHLLPLSDSYYRRTTYLRIYRRQNLICHTRRPLQCLPC